MHDLMRILGFVVLQVLERSSARLQEQVPMHLLPLQRVLRAVQLRRRLKQRQPPAEMQRPHNVLRDRRTSCKTPLRPLNRRPERRVIAHFGLVPSRSHAHDPRSHEHWRAQPRRATETPGPTAARRTKLRRNEYVGWL